MTDKAMTREELEEFLIQNTRCPEGFVRAYLEEAFILLGQPETVLPDDMRSVQKQAIDLAIAKKLGLH